MKTKALPLLALLFASAASASAEPSRQRIATENAPAAIGPYSQAIKLGDTLYVSGQIPIDPKSGQLVAEDVRSQTEQVLQNIDAILSAAGYSPRHVVQVQVYLTDMNDLGAMNAVYARYFKILPARTTVAVTALPRSAKVEIAVTAIK